jgi:hypothetical protein
MRSKVHFRVPNGVPEDAIWNVMPCASLGYVGSLAYGQPGYINREYPNRNTVRRDRFLNSAEQV